MERTIKKIAFALLVSALFLYHALWAQDNRNGFDNLIEMDELKVEGDIEKPLEIFIIPRADLQLEVELNDTRLKEFTLDEINPLILPQLLAHTSHDTTRKDTAFIKQNEPSANCVSCHYQIDYSRLSHPTFISQKINNLCIACHKTAYHNISLHEIQDMLSVYIENNNIISRKDGKITFDKNFLCNKCHQLDEVMFRKSHAAQIPDKTWNVDIMCNVCHINYISD
ncbi:MAG: hypothetical protein ACMUJM_10160 [bacterium]